MDFFYDGQVRRYVTQFMRFFIGFKYQAGDGTQHSLPVTYGDMTRQVAGIIKDNSENKMPTVPKIACYITNLELDTNRLADQTFVSKVNIRERDYDTVNGNIEYQEVQGGNYTIERLMPTPFKLSMKADIWTSNTDQKLQIIEQILIFFNPSFEIQTTDNYLDWTSLSVINLKSLNFSSRTIPVGAETEIDICTLEFDMPIYITPPAKVKKLGVVKNIIASMFTENGDVVALQDLTLTPNDPTSIFPMPIDGYGVLLLKSNNGQPNDYDMSVIDTTEAIHVVGLEAPLKLGPRIPWPSIMNRRGGYKAGLSMVYFKQPNGTEIRGTITVNSLDDTYLIVTIEDRPSNTNITSTTNPNGRTTIDAIVDPYKFNPKRPNKESSDQTVSVGVRYLVLDDINNSPNVGGQMIYGQDPTDGSPKDNYDGPDAWKNSNGADPVIISNSIIEWTGTSWNTIFDPSTYEGIAYITNLKTGIQYKWDGAQWLRSFEGEYAAGYWRFDLNPY